jgi:hypothetical protein
VRDGTGTAIRAYLGPTTYIFTNVPIRNVFGASGRWIFAPGMLARIDGRPGRTQIATASFAASSRCARYQVYDGKPPPEDDDGQ